MKKFHLLSVAAVFVASPLMAAVPIPTVPNAVLEVRKIDESYTFLLSDAWKGNEDAIGALFKFVEQGFFEGKGKAEREHTIVLWSLLRHLGDDRYVVALDREYPRLQAEVVRAIALEAGPALAKYPKTAARRNADQ